MEERAHPLRCYSRLWRLLSERKMTVAELDRALARRGVDVNVKTLYRLANPTASIDRLDTAIAGRICEILDVDLSRLLAFEAVRREMGLRRLAPAAQRRLDRLLERQTEETLSAAERKELGDLVEKAERLTAANARTLSRAREAVAPR